MARRLVGSNQYRTRWGPDLPAPDRGVGAPESAPKRLRCGEVWGGRCRTWVRPPNYFHGDHPDGQSFWKRISDPACPPQVLQGLAEYPDAAVRRGTAGNPASPPQLLGQLAEDPDEEVRQAVAGNPACPPQLLGRLARDPNEQVRGAARANPACPPQWRALDQL